MKKSMSPRKALLACHRSQTQQVGRSVCTYRKRRRRFRKTISGWAAASLAPGICGIQSVNYLNKKTMNKTRTAFVFSAKHGMKPDLSVNINNKSLFVPSRSIAATPPACWPPPPSAMCWAQRTWQRYSARGRPSARYTHFLNLDKVLTSVSPKGVAINIFFSILGYAERS